VSCEYRRRKFLGLVVTGGVAGNAPPAEVAALERIYQQAYDAAQARHAQEQSRAGSMKKSLTNRDLENRRKTHLLFAHMLRMGVQLPIHSPSGLPKPEAQAGYAALWDALKARMAEPQEVQSRSSAFTHHATPPATAALRPFDTPGTREAIATARYEHKSGNGTLAPTTPSVPHQTHVSGEQGTLSNWDSPWLAASEAAGALYDQEWSAAQSYDQEGYDREGYDRTGTNRYGYNRQGLNSDGCDRRGYDAAGRDRAGYDRDGYDRDGFNRAGFDKGGRDRRGYDWLGFDRAGFDPSGYNRYGYDRTGFDKEGYDREGYDKRGYNRRGYNRQGLDAAGVDRFGYDAQGRTDGLDRQGYDAAGLDADGYDRDGYDKEGYDRAGYDRKGRNRASTVSPWWLPDAEGYYGDGYDQHGYDRQGLDADGRDRWGFDRQGSNEAGRDRDGYDREGYNTSYLDREGYNKAGFDAQGVDRLGYTSRGQDRSGYSLTGYDKDGYDRAGVDRWGRDRKNRDARTGRQFKTLPHNKSGYDKEGYDRWGFHRDTGLTADSRNYAGWVYNPDTRTCHDPSDPHRSMPHGFYQDGHGVQWYRPKWQSRLEWDPSLTPRWDPRAPISWEEYARAHGAVGHAVGHGTNATRRSYEARLDRRPNVEERWQRDEQGRVRFDPGAASAGVLMRCPHCGQFTGCKSHQCPAFGGRAVTVYRSGLGRRESHHDYFRAGDEYSDKGVHADTRRTMDGCYVPLNSYGPFANGHSDANPRRASGVEEREPAYSNGGYDRYGYDQDGFDRFGRDRRSRDREGYDAEGFDWLGRDRDGYDRHGRDRNGYNRAGVRLPRTLRDLEGDYAAPGMEGDILANEGVRRLYSQVATSLAGKPRQVLFREGVGFATDMQGTIYLDPYPLGREAPLVYNAAVVMEGLQHEMGHELETPLGIFKRILEVASSPHPVEGLDAGRPLVKQIYNIVEDGRMERRISSLPGVAEYLAVGCKLQPRWDEQVGEVVPLEHEVQGALLYEALPYYQVRPEVLDAMTPNARSLFEELRPVVHRGVFGGAEDAYQASLEIARRLQAEGIAAPDEQLRIPAPACFFFAGAPDDVENGENGESGESGDMAPVAVPIWGAPDDSGSEREDVGGGGGTASSTGGGSTQAAGRGPAPTPNPSGAVAALVPTAEGAGVGMGPGTGTSLEANSTRSDAEGAQGRKGGTGNESREGDIAGDQAQPDAQSSGQGQPSKGNDQSKQSAGRAERAASGASAGDGGLRDLNRPFSEADVKRVLEELERDLVGAAESDIRRQSRVEALGRNLHKPIGARQDAEQVYRDSAARVRSAPVQFPTLPTGDPGVEKVRRRRSAHHTTARQLARYLENVQDVTEETLNFQTRGRMDRHRFVPALKDSPDVYRRRVEAPGAGFALSVAVDVSGSMNKEMRSGALCDAALVLGDACEQVAMPYEVRSFSSRSYQYKAMDDPTFSMERAAMLLHGEGGGTSMAQTAGLAATSLLARPERNKLFVSLSDGDLSDHDSTMRQMEQARRDGVLTFGVFLSRGGYVNRDRMDQIYGKANWTVIHSIQEMPRAVGQRIALLMRRAR
jgi:hypothetical protein